MAVEPGGGSTLSTQSTAAPVKVLFIAGWGRSGTTILDNTLGAHDGVFTAGEVYWLWQFGFLEGRKCGCGTPLPECELWGSILKSAFGDDVPDPAKMVALQKRAIGVRHTPRLLAAARSGQLPADVERYADVLGRLYRAIADLTGDQIIVDASKRPPDAVVVGRVPGIEPYLVHVVRDPRAVAYSWSRRKAWTDTRSEEYMTRHGLVMNGAHWVSWNLGAEAARLVYPPGRYLRVRYEDFMAQPRRTIDRIFGMLGMPAPEGPFLDDHTLDLPTNHTAAGNPSRFRTGEVRLANDDEWTRAQAPLARRATTAMALPLLGRYGYPLDVTAAAQRHPAGDRR